MRGARLYFNMFLTLLFSFFFSSLHLLLYLQYHPFHTLCQSHPFLPVHTGNELSQFLFPFAPEDSRLKYLLILVENIVFVGVGHHQFFSQLMHQLILLIQLFLQRNDTNLFLHQFFLKNVVQILQLSDLLLVFYYHCLQRELFIRKVCSFADFWGGWTRKTAFKSLEV